MGLNFKVVKTEAKMVDSVDCDRCFKHIDSDHHAEWNQWGEPHTLFHPPNFDEEFFLVETTWGFNSKKDGEIHQIVLCESCYDELFKNANIKVTKYDG